MGYDELYSWFGSHTFLRNDAKMVPSDRDYYINSSLNYCKPGSYKRIIYPDQRSHFSEFLAQDQDFESDIRQRPGLHSLCELVTFHYVQWCCYAVQGIFQYGSCIRTCHNDYNDYDHNTLITLFA